jgi:phosphoglycolate phosphatase
VAPAVLFDLDGVLVDSRAAIAGSMNGALVACGYPARPVADLYRYIGPPIFGAYSELLGRPFDSPEVAALVAAYRSRYAVASLSETVLAPGIERALDALSGSHVLAVATSKPRAYAVPILEALGLLGHFDYVAGPELDAQMELKAETVRRALEHVGGPPAVMVGDRMHDIEGARANGIPVIAVAWGIGDAAELAPADAFVRSPEELPEAVDRLLASPPEGRWTSRAY